ncbi:BMC domain-containing protein [Desulfosediminicola sp.]|uniref:BMC domain-containing protein n=1 Tax=Desulfosediminicola sp. TaxID=2886825 RepID=UPI003AF2E679
MDTLGIVEVQGIAGGVALADSMVKEADVELIRAATICSGRYLIFIGGDREAVSSSLTLAKESGRGLSGCYCISNVSAEVAGALQRDTGAYQGGALGVVECRNVSSGVVAADSAVKQSAVDLLRLVTGQGINGKCYFVLGGDVASVREATAKAESVLGKYLIETVVIPRPDDSVVRSLVKRIG